ncbi:DNA-binding transcriptional regulator, LysR family [Pseudomonas cuatrocienegasensis]|uniref:DNA-binding transcriptional regulator, LysR family n=1 Tax=Pseudomonas cuatrocienegasensis TaxID=543360 RepID=A0ABY1B4N4_9PSED|nr:MULTISPECIES: LysR family transcriptional regulator [Pseudomonas]OEC37263.1 hypothetical protein A7D25_00945 [Pseudomonas sp. 21C1]SEP90951.1 DNA-binding transcriptional regulator, LysR family [Pseudomonas cuatrocienegasensis]
MSDDIDLKHMRIFLQLVRYGSATKVAHETGISQQAVSNYLKRLRAIFPNELFIRQSNGLQPTDFALELADRFERVLTEVDGIFEEAPFDPLSAHRSIVVIANEYAQLAIMPRLFQALRLAAPGVTVTVVDFDESAHERQLASGEADMVIGFSGFMDDCVLSVPLRTDYYCCVVGMGSKVAEKITKISDLSGLAHVDFANAAAHLGTSVDSFLEEQKINRNVIATLPCYTALSNFLALNDVVAFVPLAVAEASQMKVLSFETMPKAFEVSIGWHRRSSGSAVRKWFLELALGCIK